MKKHFFAPLVLLAINISCGDSEHNVTTTNNTTTNNTTVVSDTIKHLTEEEKIEAGIDKSIEVINGLSEIVKERREARNAAKDPMWVYQIGAPINSLDKAIEECNRYDEIKNIFVFKKSKREYYLIKDDGYLSENELKDSLDNFARKISSYTNARIKPVDLSQECTSKKYPTTAETEKKKIDGEIVEVECLICN